MEEHLVFYPSPGIGHLVSMVELAKRFFLLNPNHCRYHLTVILAEPPFNTGKTAPYIRRISAAYPSITFHRLPPISLPLERSTSRHREAFFFRLAHLNNPLLLDALSSMSSSGSPVRAVILDFFCHPALDVFAELGIPSYLFFTSPASVLSVFLHVPTVQGRMTASYGDMSRDTRLEFPGMPPFSPQDMPLPYMDKHDEAYEGFVGGATRLANSTHGMLVNTFDLLEPRALKALSDNIFTLDHPIPPIYAIGPLITSDSEGSDEGHDCLKWLDLQPPKSVVFLSFGSLGLFSAEQLKEIAIGLEKSGQRFLWVVRSPPVDKDATHVPLLAPPEPDLEELMPKGFLERTRERGMVVKSWAPQVAVLSRKAVGGFMTHCGWNSILEAIWAGMPMVAWPLYAEQRLNRVLMVEETRLAIPMDEDEKGFVTAEEVERRVRELMESEEGQRLRERTAEMRMAAISAWGKGGSSHRALSELVQSWRGNRS